MGKMFDRLLLFVFSLATGILSIYALVMVSHLISYDSATEFLHDVYYDSFTAYSWITIAVVLLLLSARLFYISIKKSRGQAPSIDQRTDFGDIRISIETVENLALKAASRHRGVKDLKARVNVNDAGLEIIIRTIVDGESSIPELTEEVQRSVKEHVEEITGIPVAFVSVFIANIISQAPTFRSRVE
jgi:uncharacterized alkaline shock family protein YloU